MSGSPGPVVLGGYGVFVPAEDAAALSRQLDLVIAALCRVRPGVARPQPPRTLVQLRDAVRAVAAEHAAAQHRHLAGCAIPAQKIAPTPAAAAGSTLMIGTTTAATLTGRSTEFWRVRAADGRVPAHRVGRAWLLDRAAVMSEAS